MSNTATTQERRMKRWIYQFKHNNYTLNWKNPQNKKFIALYGLFRKSPNGSIEGYIENSLEMGWSDKYVLVMSHDRALKELNGKLREKYDKELLKKGYKYFIYRVTRQNYKAEIQSFPPSGNLDKFKLRNWEFYCASNIPF